MLSYSGHYKIFMLLGLCNWPFTCEQLKSIHFGLHPKLLCGLVMELEFHKAFGKLTGGF